MRSLLPFVQREDIFTGVKMSKEEYCMKIKIGDPFPNLSATDINGKSTSISELKGKKVIVYFYPKDNTPGCTIQANDFNDNLDAIHQKGAEVIGVSKDGEKSHEKFCGKYSLQFPLATDEGGKVGKELGIMKFTGTHSRTTFLLDEEGKVLEIFENVSPKGHAEELLNKL